MAALTLRNVSKSYQSVHVLKDINIEIDSGEFLVLLGPSGCGKSTLLNSLAGLTNITAGDIVIDGKRVNDVPCDARDIAMVFQSYALYPSMTVRNNIGFPLEMRKISRADRKEAIARVAALLQIGHLLDRKPGQLSGGQRQRVAIGRALVRDPRLFLFDEPLSNLDALLRVEMRMELKKLHQRIRKTTVYVTHDQVEAMTLATRIAVLHDGRLQQLGTPSEVYERPANLFVATFIGSPSMNLLPGRLIYENGRFKIRIAGKDAVSVELPVPVDVGVRLRLNQEITMGIRPEWIRLRGDDAAGERSLTLPATVSLVELIGPEEIALLNVAGHDISARFGVNEVPRAGSVEISVDTRKCLIFDSASGELII